MTTVMLLWWWLLSWCCDDDCCHAAVIYSYRCRQFSERETYGYYVDSTCSVSLGMIMVLSCSLEKALNSAIWQTGTIHTYRPCWLSCAYSVVSTWHACLRTLRSLHQFLLFSKSCDFSWVDLTIGSSHCCMGDNHLQLITERLPIASGRTWLEYVYKTAPIAMGTHFSEERTNKWQREARWQTDSRTCERKPTELNNGLIL
jgi:hypothetical protein